MGVAAIFDIDGTLVTFTFDVKGTRNALLQELAKRGFDTSGLDLTTPTQRILDAARAQVPSDSDRAFVELRNAAFSILDSFELSSAGSASAFPGTRDALLYLRSKGVRIAVLTNSGRKAAFQALKRADLLDCFEFVLTRNDIDAMKPRPDGLLKAVSKLGLPKEDVYYVGDSPFDITAAKEAGLKVISVATGSYTKERLASDGADYIISSLGELHKVLGV